MTSKPLVFQFQHLLWQQRVSKERGEELRVKDDNEMFRTFTDKLPKYLETMDRKKQKHFRGSHPQRYQLDTVSLASSKRSLSINQATARRMQITTNTDDQRSHRSTMSTSQRLQAMSTRASGRLAPLKKPEGQSASHTKGFNELADENHLYEEAVGQINRKLALRNAIERANREIALSRAGSRPSGLVDLNDDRESVAQRSVFSQGRKSNNNSNLNRDDRSDAVSCTPSRMSLIAQSQKVALQGREDRESQRSGIFSRHSRQMAEMRIEKESLASNQMRSTAHSLVDTLAMQLERERQQKRKLLEHLVMLEQTQQK